MWKEIDVNDINALEKYTILRNSYGCSVNFTIEKVKFQINRLTDCHLFLYEDNKFTLMVGFKLNPRTKKIIFVGIAMGILKIKDYPIALKLIGNKIREHLIEKNNVLEMPSSLIFEDLHPNVKKIGFDKIIEVVKKAWEECGLIVDWIKDKYIRIEVDGN